MTRQLIAAVIPIGVTYCTRDGSPYPADESGIIHMLPAHLTELTVRGVASTATAAQMAASKHCGAPLIITVG